MRHGAEGNALSGTWLLAGALLLGQVTHAPQPPSVARLVAELDAPERSRRDAAEQQLLKLGPAALAELPATDASMPAETRLRLTRVRGQLERSRAEQSIQASRVTLVGGDLPLSAVLTDIEKQTGNRIADFRPQFGERPADVRLKLNLRDVPFWRALDEILDQAKLTVYSFAGSEGLAIVSRSAALLPRTRGVDYEGAFRVAAGDFIARRDLRLVTAPTLQLDLEAAWEPRLRPILIMHAASAVAATDDRGQPVPTAGGGEVQEVNVAAGVHSIELPIQFVLPPRSAARLKSVKGSFSVLLPASVEEFRFADLKKQRVVERRGGATVTLERADKNGDVWEVRILVAFDKTNGALESHRNWIFNNPAWLERPGGEKIEFAGTETTRQAEDEVGLAYLFNLPAGLDGYKFVYRTPTSIQTTRVDYELKDLPLP